MNRFSTLTAAVVLMAMPVFAADLGNYSNWNDSPQGWFMTKAERDQWATLASEADAEKFVADFLAKRDPKFAKEIATRVEMADKYLTVGKTRGSESLRGKVVILLGPPSSMDVAEKKKRSGGRSGSVDMSVGATGGSVGPGMADVAEIAERDAMSAGATGLKIYTITYAAEQLPTKQGISVVLEVNGATGKDRINDKRQASELAKIYDAVAEASIEK